MDLALQAKLENILLSVLVSLQFVSFASCFYRAAAVVIGRVNYKAATFLSVTFHWQSVR